MARDLPSLDEDHGRMWTSSLGVIPVEEIGWSKQQEGLVLLETREVQLCPVEPPHQDDDCTQIYRDHSKKLVRYSSKAIPRAPRASLGLRVELIGHKSPAKANCGIHSRLNALRRPTLVLCVLLFFLACPFSRAQDDDEAQNDGNVTWHCGCASCTQSVWDTRVANSTCGSLIRNAQRQETREAACTRIASEFADCAPCGNLGCDQPAPRYCGCWNCGEVLATEDVTASAVTEEKITCGDRGDEMLLSNPLLSEWDACTAISDILPDSCGRSCNPGLCKEGETVGTIDRPASSDDLGGILGWSFAVFSILVLLVLLFLLARLAKKRQDPEMAPGQITRDGQMASANP